MKLNVVVDKTGKIVGSSQVGVMKADDGTQIELGVIAGPEQTIHEIEVGDDIMRRPIAEVQQEIQKALPPYRTGGNSKS